MSTIAVTTAGDRHDFEAKQSLARDLKPATLTSLLRRLRSSSEMRRRNDVKERRSSSNRANDEVSRNPTMTCCETWHLLKMRKSLRHPLHNDLAEQEVVAGKEAFSTRMAHSVEVVVLHQFLEVALPEPKVMLTQTLVTTKS
jgi:hypothetical protein